MKNDQLSVDEIRVQAPAKINLILRILNRLPNGYHSIWSLMHTLDLADGVTIRLLRESRGIQLSCRDSAVPVGRHNLIIRAAELVLSQAGKRIGLEIDLEKQIPMAAGLGGGSSDAAATIWGIDRLLGLNWSQDTMAKVGSELGSDVPFFFSAPSAIVCEWGQTVIPIGVKGDRWILLINPGFPIETKWAYEQVSTSREAILPINPSLKAIQDGKFGSWDDLTCLMENDFESALFPKFPILEGLKTDLLTLGAEAALLSGSGSTMLGVFSDKQSALQAREKLALNSESRVFIAHSEAGSPLKSNL